jgi:cellulose synthase/poly-beta-1,6-N-acetylglucosamine synthase-like glycosyltransferase
MNVSFETAIWLLWGLWLLQGLFGWFNVFMYRIRMRWQDERLSAPLEKPLLPAVLLAPMKGIRHNFEPYVGELLNQDYPNYHVIFSVESTRDPLYSKLRDRIGLSDDKLIWRPEVEPAPQGSPEVSPGLKRVQLIIAGLCETGAQKVHNQLQALRELRDEDALIAASDADILPPRNLLRQLLGPLNQGTHTAATGYRWIIPMNRNLGMLTASVVNGSVATMGGPEWCNLMWGGAHALTREFHEEIDLSDKFVGAFNDDLQTAYHVRKAGKKIAYLRSLMLPSPEDYNWSSMFGFSWRQYFHVRIYAPWAWWSGLFVTALYLCATLTAWSAIITGYFKAFIPIAFVFVLNEMRAHQRIELMKTLFSGKHLEALKPTFALERFATFFWMFVHFLTICRSGIGQIITWSGITYRVTGRQKTEVIMRNESDKLDP